MSQTNLLFIFPYSAELQPGETQVLLSAMQRFLSQWNTHGTALQAQARFEEQRFLIVEVDPQLALPSGCSKDKLYHFIVNENKKQGFELDPAGFFYAKKEDQILTCTKAQLLQIWQEGDNVVDYQLFPTWITSVDAYESSWGKPLKHFATILRLGERKPTFAA